LIKVDDASKRYDELIAKGIVIRNRTTQPLCENLRLTVGTVENKKINGCTISDKLNAKRNKMKKYFFYRS
jgi:histidinol-phosphate/aromatic aminotransferase/cobyric acid decarboxylase-like protein